MTCDSRFVGKLMMLMAPKGHFFTQMPHPIHSRSEMNAILDSGATSIQSFPVRTTGHDFLHSCRHFYRCIISARSLVLARSGGGSLWACTDVDGQCVDDLWRVYFKEGTASRTLSFETMAILGHAHVCQSTFDNTGIAWLSVVSPRTYRVSLSVMMVTGSWVTRQLGH